ncbi:aspartate/tyrosine/aromatic aminotransferase [Herbaspirillum sp. HC18]|nr:aspartate/tyrosine/aromatic aminotransferase [Herbaspirillum sp. HC18]
MNARFSPSLFHAIDMAPRDATIGVNDMFTADPNPHKINLGVGIYQDEMGNVPLLKCVKRAEQHVVEALSPRTYLPIDGLAAYREAVQDLVFGADSTAVRDKRVVTIQTLGGTGALKVGADFLRKFSRSEQVWVSDPSWENHRGLFETAGFAVNSYPYYDNDGRGVNFEGMLDALHTMPSGSIVLLHPCCHNPTGFDLNHDQWERVIAIVVRRELIPFIDVAYQGFGSGIEEDCWVVRRFAETTAPLFVANSFSKSFSLYGERIGALSIVADDADEVTRVLSQIKRVVRTNYSNPPMHGSRIVASILMTPDLRRLWDSELAAMRARILKMRSALVERLREKAPKHDFDFVMRQRGMFSYSGLTAGQVNHLREEFSIYAIATGRICMASINDNNIDRIASAFGKALEVQ